MDGCVDRFRRLAIWSLFILVQDVGDEPQLAAVLELYPTYRAIWAVHQNEAFGDKVCDIIIVLTLSAPVPVY